MAAESTTEDAQVSEPKTPKKGDFEKGRSKTGGKRPPIPKLSGKAAREYLREHSNALEVLVRITRGLPVKIGGPTGKKNIYHHPDWHDVRWATEIALRKLVPDLQSQELTGDGDNPIAIQATRAMQDNPREMARRLETLLTSAGLADVVGKALGAGEDNTPALEAPTPPTGDAESPETPETANARPEASNDAEEPLDQDEGLKPPPIGKRLVFAGCSVEVEARAQRPGDPALFVARRDRQDLKFGSWALIELFVRKLLGGGQLPRAEIRDVPSSRGASSSGASDSPEWSRRHYG